MNAGCVCYLRGACTAATTSTDTVASETARYLPASRDRKSTRLNSSHVSIAYAVFCLKEKKFLAVRLVQAHARGGDGFEGTLLLGDRGGSGADYGAVCRALGSALFQHPQLVAVTVGTG